MELTKGKVGNTYKIENITSADKIKKFLFTIGCFQGEEITLISKLASNYVVNIKDSRYAIDESMARAIQVS